MLLASTAAGYPAVFVRASPQSPEQRHLARGARVPEYLSTAIADVIVADAHHATGVASATSRGVGSSADRKWAAADVQDHSHRLMQDNAVFLTYLRPCGR
eukprot:2497095-Alexandrium_andersonii.AAC.1